MPQDHEPFMRLAIEEAAKGGAEGNPAVGSVITRDGAVVARGRNLVTATHDPTAHAPEFGNPLSGQGPGVGFFAGRDRVLQVHHYHVGGER